MEASAEETLCPLIVLSESDWAPGGGSADGLAAPTGGDLGTGKLMTSP